MQTNNVQPADESVITLHLSIMEVSMNCYCDLSIVDKVSLSFKNCNSYQTYRVILSDLKCKSD